MRLLMVLRLLAMGTCLVVALGNGSVRALPPSSETIASDDLVLTISEADDLLMRGDYAAAVDAFRSLGESGVDEDRARLGLAMALMRMGRYDEARGVLNEPFAAPSAARHGLLARLAVATGRYEDAIQEAREAIQVNADDAGARRTLAETLEILGRRDEAIEAYRWFDRQLVEKGELPQDAAWLTDAAVGFYRYSVLTRTDLAQRTRHVLHDMLQPAYVFVDRTYWPARIAAADLLREKYNNNEQDGSVSDYRAALKVNPNLPEAHVGLGTIRLDQWDFDAVEEHTEKALTVNPNFAPAIHLEAAKFLKERRYEQAGESADRALAINSRDLTALSLRAAAHACRGDEPGMKAIEERVRAINARCGLFYRTLGDAYGGIRQYAASQRQYLQAIEYDPTDANARTELGMMYMQWGREREARDALDGAWALDPFNERTKFTLELLDSLEAYARHETEHFLIRFDARHDPGLGPFVGAYLEEIYGELVEDYECEPPERTIVELFPSQRAFAVRITGKPWIHTVGACTGRVIALASPRQAPGLSGPYNIATVLKHEFTHTVTLAATANRIPHWFTEGLAVLQENTPRSFVWSQLLAEAARRDELFTLESIDWGFIRPKRPTDRQMAYAQSEWMCEYIIEGFGYDSINAMLERFKRGQTLEQVFQEELGSDLKTFDRSFQAWAQHQAASLGFDVAPPEDPEALETELEDKPEEAALLGRLARARYDRAEYDAALATARRALSLDETQAMALRVAAEVLVQYARQEMLAPAQAAYLDQAVPLLERLWDIDPTGWTAPKYLAEIALGRQDPDRAMEPLRRLQRVCPQDPTSWRGLGGIHLERNELDAALPQLLGLVRMELNDVEVRAQLGRIYKRRGELRPAQYWLRQALYVDPFSVEVRHALAEVNMRADATSEALEQYLMLTQLEPDRAEWFEQAALAAHKLGDHERAVELARRAVELAPDSSARTLLP